MSYLSLPRLTFSGLFEADVNTINNDVRNYSVETFQPRLQTPSEMLPDGRIEYNGWWNPSGTNNFRLLNCAPSGAVGEDGAAVTDDVALSLHVEAQASRTSAKIVDLDPQFQFASGLWGLRIGLMQGGHTLMSGELLPSCFRDIYFGRLALPDGEIVPRSPGASARFTGALANVRFDLGTLESPFLRALARAARANGDRLSMSLMTHGYSRTPGEEGFTTGRVIGSIGPHRAGEPLSFVAGRRFAPNIPQNNPFAGTSGIGFMDAELADDGSRLSVDFGNSLPLVLTSSEPGATIKPKAMGPLRVVVLKQADEMRSLPDGSLQLSASSGADQTVTPAQYESIGALADYDGKWFSGTGGVVDFSVPEPARKLVADHPLAILYNEAPSGSVIAVRETVAGLFARADDFIKRVDAAAEGWVSTNSTIYARRYGAPFANAPLVVTLDKPTPGQGGTSDSTEVNPPQVEIPLINFPGDRINCASALKADGAGVATMQFWASNPGNPRRYLDGQIYVFNYGFNAAGGSSLPMFEVVGAHVRDAFTPPARPSWESDIAPVLVQYGNLYPIMSRGLFSLSDYATVAENAGLLYHAFSLPIEDANYMPATRDLSAGKRRMLLDWLAGFLTGAPADEGALPVAPVGSLLATPAPAATTPTAPGGEAPTPAALGGRGDDKAAAFRAFFLKSPRKTS